MKNLIFVFGILLFSGVNIFAQDVPGVANGSIAKNGRDDYDNGIRIRSMELERIKLQNYGLKVVETRKLNYSQIKKDFELVQKLQNTIVKTYVTGKNINYQRIAELASNLNECAKRLDTNLLLTNEETPKKTDKKFTEIKDVKEVIVLLDKAVGNFVVSPVFQNMHVYDAVESEKTEGELRNIIRLSFVLEQKSKLQ
ncbi:MAG TPA: hypothetical protein PKY59_14660 [Pyrinomonadaceae bacterium]|nr:hypothetical protein [Pyrinomonadaceae bacterium]